MYSSSSACSVSPLVGLMIGQGVDLVAEQLDAQAELLVGRPDLDHVAAHPELAAREGDVVALVLNVHQAQQQIRRGRWSRP